MGIFNNKPEFVVIFVRTENTANIAYKIKKSKEMVSQIKIGNHSFIVDWSKPFYLNGKKRIYFIDFEKGEQLVPIRTPTKLNSEELDLIVGTKIIKEITSAVSENKKDKIIFFVIGAIIGFLAGFIVNNFIMQGKIDELVAQMSQTVIPLP